ncbi:hypothetical protein SAMN05192560_2113 [Methylobacillus rhizosphaerae]|uniref:Outer membrane lipoprotein-sorting protein n=1 Tax=Methylobacillus rhizosphaerae TaxID=551994 RepID=A0A239ATS1_9PROT|nr:hypothetical protein [Methylobacillus rhizosphaerae]SNR99095.1 hypothetical protein SAMN05192560_2113 [Methylobacillus rhizosphaerae]
MKNRLVAAWLMMGWLPGHAVAGTLPALDARFETIQCVLPCQSSVKREWLMMREATQVEIRDMHAAHSELWQRRQDGQLEYAYLLHEKQRAIDYTNIDLNLLGIASDDRQWQVLTQLVTQQELAGLDKRPGPPWQRMATDIYRGRLNGVDTEVTWIPALSIPLQLTYHYPGYQVKVKMVERYHQQLPVVKTTNGILHTYAHVDFTDIGDMEHDRNALSWLDLASGGAPGLSLRHHAPGEHDHWQ